MLRFVTGFILVLVVCYALLATPWVRHTGYPALLDLNAAASAGVLRLLGEETRAHGPTVISPRSRLLIMRGCDALDPAILLIAAVIAFPAPWRSRFFALALGVPLLLAANLVRIISLHYVRVHAPALFETVHVDVWQVAFILLTMLMWSLWALHAERMRAPANHANQQ